MILLEYFNRDFARKKLVLAQGSKPSDCVFMTCFRGMIDHFDLLVASTLGGYRAPTKTT